MIDTLYALKSIPLATTIQDSVVTNTSIRGGIDIGIQDSLNFVLSGSPTVMLETSGQTDWTAIIGFATIFMNIVVLVITFCYNRKLQKTETDEIRTRVIQEVAVKKQATLYEMMVDLSYLIQDPNDDSSKFFEDKLEKTKLFISTNHLYIKDNLEKITYDLLNIFSTLTEMPDAKIMDNIDKKLAEYCKVYNTPNKTRETEHNRILNTFKNIFYHTHRKK